MLLPALQDQSHAVVVGAVRGLAAIGRLDDLQPLRQLLRSDNEEVQLEAAVALARLGDAKGVPALDCMAYSDAPEIRAAAARAMGELANASFTGTLVRLLDDPRVTVSRAALLSLPKAAGHDAAESADGSPVGTAEQNPPLETMVRGRAVRAAERCDGATLHPLIFAPSAGKVWVMGLEIRGETSMDRVTATVELANPKDPSLRALVVSALVDTGALTLCLPEHVGGATRTPGDRKAGSHHRRRAVARRSLRGPRADPFSKSNLFHGRFGHRQLGPSRHRADGGHGPGGLTLLRRSRSP